MVNLFRLVQALGKRIGDEIPLRQLSKESGVPYTTTLRLVDGNAGLFIVNKKGNMKLVSLNLEDSLTKSYLVIAERKATERFLKKQPMFSMLTKEFPAGDYSVVLFGSRAEGTNREKSDADLCVISRNGEKKARFTKLELIYRIEANPIYLKDSEFSKMLREKEQNVGKEILGKHIILYGEEHFWNLIFKDGI